MPTGLLPRALDQALGLVFQRDCLLCGGRSWGAIHGALCKACWDSLPSSVGEPGLPEGLDQLVALGPYDGAWRDLVHAYKFFGHASLQRPLAARLSAALPAFGPFDAIACPPASGLSLGERGRDVVAELARRVARRAGVPFQRPFRRSGPRLPQRSLSLEGRRANAEGAFYACRPLPPRVLLIDDVMASGATLGALTHAARLAGASWVGALCVARSERGMLGS